MLRKLFTAFVILSALPTIPAVEAQAATPATATSSQFKASTVSTGDAHTCALDDAGSVWCWGSNSNGQLGDGTKTARLVPTRVPALSGVTRVQAGAKFSCALRPDGTVWCWGFNSFGQLGDGTKLDRLVPTRVPALSGVTALAGGASSLAPMCALRSDGSAWCWGANTLGQLGDGSKAARLAPVKVRFPGSITVIAPGATSCLVSSGTPFCWGQNNLGQIGDGTKTARLAPTAVSRLGEITRIATSPTTTCAIDADARTWCWGGNAQGRVGDGTTVDRLTPVRVLDLDAATRIASGDATCAVTPAGALRCWGSNTAGAVGDGTRMNRRAPVAPVGTFSAVDVATSTHSCAAAAAGDVWCWGQGAAGQLGNAQRLVSLSPQLASPTATTTTTTTIPRTTTTTIPRTTTTSPATTTTTIPRSTTTTPAVTTTIPRTTTTTPAVTTTVPAPAAPAAPQLAMRAPLVQGTVSNALVSFPLTPGAVAYRAECRAGAQRLPAAGTTSPILVPQLTAGASYACSLSVNVRGAWSAPSELSNTAVAYRTPTPPTNVAATVIPTSPGDVSVAFSPSAENGAAVSSYRATCFSTAGSTSRRFATSPTSPVVVVGIPPGRAYVCTVAAQNQGGWSPESIPSTAFATFAPAAAPANLAAAATDRAVSLSWSPVASTSTAPVTGYRVYRADSLVCQVLVPATSCTASGLQNGTEYAFQVLAYHLSTEGALSDPVTATPFAAADAPVIENVELEPSATSVKLLLATSSAQGSALTTWQVSCSSAQAQFSVEEPASGLSSEITLSQLAFGTEYSCTARARNQAGWSDPSAPVSFSPYTTPDAPGNLTLAVDDASFSISWDEPSGNGSPVLSYTVEWSSNGSDWSEPVEVADTSYVLTGLTNGTPHTVRVRAENLAGASAPTAATDTPVARPTAPTALEAVPHDGRLAVSWIQPDTISAGVQSWRVLINGELACTATRESCSVTGLQNGVTYAVSVVAVGRTGVSPAAAPIDATPYGAPDAPSLAVSLRDPSGRDVSSIAGVVTPAALNGAAMTRAELLCSAPDPLSDDPSTFSVLVNDRTPVIAGARPGLAYTCRARIENAGGWSPWSATSSPVVPYRTPDAPGITVSLVNETPTSVSVVVPDPVFDGGRSITAYGATCSSETGQTRSATATTSPVTVNNLTPGATYVCRSRVENLAGWSPFSEDSDRIYPRTTPDAPTGVEVTANPDGTVTVRWSAPVFDGGAPIARYTVTVPSSNSTCSTTELSCTLDGLDVGTEYSFVVSATNIAGAGPVTSPSTGTPVSVPSAPAAPTAAAVPAAPTSAQVAFAPVSAFLPVSAYSVVCSSSTGTTRGAVGTDSPLTVTALTPGATYTCTVAAQNQAGWSASSPVSNAFAAYESPAMITGLRATPSDTTVTLAWDALANTPATPVAGYRVFHADASLACLVTDPLVTSCTVTGLQNGTSYSFQVAAFYQSSEGALSASISATPRTVPDAPATPAAALVDAAPTSLTVAFQPPAANGAPVTSYTATCASSNGGTTRSATGSESPLTVLSLTPAVAYTCTVTAANDAGASAASAASDPVFPFDVPDAPATPAVSVVTATPTSLTVAFQPPAANGAPVTSYTATCASSNGGTTRSATGSESPLTVSALTAGGTYACTVTAANAAGASAPSAASAAVVPYDNPGTLPGLTASPLNSSVLVSWDALANTPATPVAGYRVFHADASLACLVTDPLVTSCTVTGLQNGTSYSFQAAAFYGTVEGPLSDAVSTSPRAVPDAPATPDVTVMDASPTSVIVAFQAPSANGSAITSYTTMCTSPDGGTTRTATGSESPLTVSSLTAGSTYACTVTAANAAGTGAASPASLTVVPYNVPGTPSGVTATPASNQVTVAWDPMTSTPASPVAGYRVFHADASLACLVTDPLVTSCTVTGLQNGSSYSFQVAAFYQSSEGALSAAASATPRTVPDAPATPAVSVVTATPTSLTVAFQAPSANGAPVTSYTATCASSNGGTTRSATGSESPLTVSSLTAGGTYACTVTAANAAGASAPSAASAAVGIAAPPSAPATPAAVVVATTPTSATVAFTAPANDGGSAITSYTATCASSNGGTTRTASGAESPLTVASLTPGKTYTCTVTAQNAAGTGSASAASNTISPYTTPDAPSGVTASPVGDDTASVELLFESPNDGGSPITGYQALCTSSNGGAPASISGTTSPMSVFPLTAGKTYTCSVAASNAAGTGPSSGLSDPVVPFSAPGAPSTPTITLSPSTPTTASVAFQAPSDNGSAIFWYGVTCSSSNGGTTRTATGSESPLAVSSLTAGRSYVCQVTAANAAGFGQSSAVSSSFVPYNRPSTPTGLSGTSSNNQVTLSWNAVTSTTAAPVAGYRVYVGASLGCTAVGATTTTCAVTSLQNGTPYSFQVAAYYEATESPLSTAITLTPNGLPSAPQVTAASASAGAVTLTFQAGAANGSAITGHTATCTSGNGGTTRTASGTASPLTVSSLTAGATYSCSVTSTNGVGTSPASNAATVSSQISSYDCPSGGSHIGGGTCQQTQYNYDWTCPSGGSLSGTTCVNGYTASDSYGASLSCWNATYLDATGTNWVNVSYPRILNSGGYNACGAHIGYNEHRTKFNGCWSSASAAAAFGDAVIGCRTDRFVNVRRFRGGGHSYSCPSGGSLSGTTCFRSWWVDTSYAATWAHVSTSYPTYTGTPVWQYSASV